jgi:hypothetical protein
MMDMVCNLFVIAASMIYIYKEVPSITFPPLSFPFSLTKSVSTQTYEDEEEEEEEKDYTMLFD